MERRLFRYILRHSARDQVVILMIVAASMIFYFISLDLPKRIVNQAIQGRAFPEDGATANLLRVAFGVPDFLGGGTVTLFNGLDLERLPYLLVLSGLFLLMVVVNNGFKFYINTFKGRLGERLLRRLRYELLDRILRFPLPHFRKVKAAEMATMIKDEVEPLGGFIGEAFVTPAFLGGQALTAVVFIMAQNWILGTVAVLVVGLQVGIVPRLRRRVLVLGRERQLTARQLAGRIAEIVDGIQEVRANDTSNYERADIAARLGRIFRIRFEIYQRKFFVKLVNNFLAQLTPFFFYSAGGYFAIKGQLDIGALVAVIAAYKDLPGPMKELLDWDQQRLDVQIKYEQVVDQFHADDFVAPERQDPERGRDESLSGDIVASNLAYADDIGLKLVDGVALHAPLAGRLAIVGPPGSGKAELAQMIAGLIAPTGGSLSLGDVDPARAPEAVLGRHVAYVGPTTYLMPQSLRDNMLYALKHVPAEGTAPDDPHLARDQAEARRTGNTLLNAAADWIDYRGAGLDSADAIDARLIEVLLACDFERDVFELGLRSVVDPANHPDITAGALDVRKRMAERLAEPGNEGIVERFDPERYNQGATVGENLLFGLPVGDAFQMDRLALNPYVRSILDTSGLGPILLDKGLSVARTMVEIFADLPPGHEFFERYSFIRHDELPVYKGMLVRASANEPLTDDDNARLIGLALKLLPTHRLEALDEDLQRRIVEVRKLFAQNLPESLRANVEFFDPARYIVAGTLLDNMLFGKVSRELAQADAMVDRMLAEVLDTSNHRRDVIRAGLDYQVGVGGARLTAAQRQKVGLARAMLKRPDLVVLNEATAGLDAATHRKVMEALMGLENTGIVAVLHRASLAQAFDQVVMMKGGRVAEHGAYDELVKKDGAFAAMASAD